MPEIYGIDVSKYQNTVDWKKVKAAGKSFVFVRIGWVGWEGELNYDTLADSHIKGAKKEGLNVGAYVYSYCKTPEAAKRAAKETIARLKQYEPLEYPVAFDIEDTSQGGTPYHMFGKSLNSSIVRAFLNETEKLGYYGMLYTYKSFADTFLDMSALNGYDVWIAHYAEKCGYSGKYGVWQYEGGSGRCDGVAGACDLNMAYKDYAAIMRESGLNGHCMAQQLQSEESVSEKENASLREKTKALESKLKQILEIVS